MVQIAVERQQTATGSATEFDAELFESSADTIGSQFWVFREVFDLLDGYQGGFLGWVMWSGGLIVQPGKLFFGPSFECGMHGLPTHVQVACNRLGVPSLGVQQHNGPSALKGVVNLGIAG